MPLIEDIAPRKGPRSPSNRSLSGSLRQFHRATNLRNVPRPDRPAPLKDAAVKTKAKPADAPGRWQRLGDFAQYPLIAGLAIGSAYNTTVGQVLIAVYLLVATALRISSRFSFGAALLLLVSVPIFQLIGLSGVSQSAAIYTYELLVVGTVQAVVETWLAHRRDQKRN